MQIRQTSFQGFLNPDRIQTQSCGHDGFKLSHETRPAFQHYSSFLTLKNQNGANRSARLSLLMNKRSGTLPVPLLELPVPTTTTTLSACSGITPYPPHARLRGRGLSCEGHNVLWGIKVGRHAEGTGAWYNIQVQCTTFTPTSSGQTDVVLIFCLHEPILTFSQKNGCI